MPLLEAVAASSSRVVPMVLHNPRYKQVYHGTLLQTGKGAFTFMENGTCLWATVRVPAKAHGYGRGFVRARDGSLHNAMRGEHARMKR